MSDPKESESSRPRLVDQQTLLVGVTRYDRVTSFLMAMIITVGLLTMALGAIWACNQALLAAHELAEIEVIEIIEDVSGGGAEDGWLDSSLEAPGPTSLTQETSEAYDHDDVISDFPEMERNVEIVLRAVSDAVAMSDQSLTEDGSRHGLPGISDQILADSRPGSATLRTGSRGTGTRRNIGKGPGDGGGVKRQERWEIRFASGQTMEEYASQLDYFRVELGAIIDGKLHLVSKLSSLTPVVRESSGGSGEKRLYFSWRGGGRRETDLELLRRARVPLSRDVVTLQFYPFETEQLLARIERDYARERGTNDLRLVRKTRFEVVQEGSGYRFMIIRQEYFRQPTTD